MEREKSVDGFCERVREKWGALYSEMRSPRYTQNRLAWGTFLFALGKLQGLGREEWNGRQSGGGIYNEHHEVRVKCEFKRKDGFVAHRRGRALCSNISLLQVPLSEFLCILFQPEFAHMLFV